MRLAILKLFYRWMIRRDEARRQRLMELWPHERANVDREFVRELRNIKGALSSHYQQLQEIEYERIAQEIRAHQR